ncbi:MAG: glycogen debranching enzyme GlgX, partial [Myxococcaceae bacterium]|nr:glycogen debranching enzyme GlgX [Myxococcaceae bacterium]
NQLGPTLTFRGLDNTAWYWLDERDRSKYRDFTGCGNSLDARQLEVNKFIADSLRHWVTEFHVDGFRFDLATTLARSGGGDFDPRCDFFAVLHQDPVLSRVKLIAEPWDVGPGGYRLGGFPAPFAEWNDRYRRTVRRFWRGDGGQVAELGYRLTGSSDFFKPSGRRPSASVNYVTCHDGFTLRDLVSFHRKHNEANLEGNADGADENHAFNHGVEGDTGDAAVLDARERTQRNLLATLLLSLGTPMLLAGDELNRTQRGNNNAYCQDSELSWVDWALDARGRRLLDFTRRCLALRASSPVLTRRNFFQGQTLEDSRFRDVAWFHPAGRELERADWENPELRCLGMFLGGDAIGTRDPRGRKIVGQSLLVWLNAGPHDVDARLPPRTFGEAWAPVLETASDEPRQLVVASGGVCPVPARSLVVLALVHA